MQQNTLEDVNGMTSWKTRLSYIYIELIKLLQKKMFGKKLLTHLCLVSHKKNIRKQCMFKSDAASDLGLHCVY